MVLNLKNIVLFVAVLLGIFYFIIKSPSQEDVLIQHVNELSEKLEFQKQLSFLEVSNRLNKIRPYFVEDVEIVVVSNDFNKTFIGWKIIQDNLLLGTRLLNSLNVNLKFNTISIQKNRAYIEIIAMGRGTDSQSIEFEEKILLNLHLIKKESWQIEKFKAERM